MGQGDQDWLAEAIIDFLRGPLYINPLMSFIDERCLIFTPEEENKFEYTTIHEEFKELVDQLLMDFLAELGLDAEAFYKVVSEAQHEDKLTAFVVQTILTVDDFLMFKAMMVKRNVELTNQVLRLVDEAAGGKAGLAYAPTPASTTVTDTLKAEETEALSKALALSRQVDAEAAEAGKLQAAMRSLQIEDEDVALSLALAASLRDGNALDTEMAELEHAIALSLALEAERLRLLAAQQAAASAAAGKGGAEPSPPASDVGKVLATAKVPLAALAPVSSSAPQAQVAAGVPATSAGGKQPAAGAPAPGALKAPAPPGTPADQANADLMMGGALLRAASSVRKTAGAGFKSDPAGSSVGGSSGGVDLASVRDAARLAAESQKGAAGGKGGKGGEEAQRWLTEQKRRLVAAKKQQRDLEMDQYRSGRGMGPGGAEGLVPPPKPDPNDGLEAKRAALRDKLAQKIKENLLGQQQQQQQ